MDLSDSSAASARDSLDAFIESYNIGAEPAPIQKAASQLPPLSSPKPVLAAVVQSASSPLRGIYADQDAGGRFEFGSYPQGADGEIRPIVWRVLRRDADGLLAVAEKGLDAKEYHDRHMPVTWHLCSLRRWLNGEFFNKAFNEHERGLVLRNCIANDAGSDTEDRVFLLSAGEAESLFADDKARRCKPTEFAVKNGAHGFADPYRTAWYRRFIKCGEDGCCSWWLRSRGKPDYNKYYEAVINCCGCLENEGGLVFMPNIAVRPVKLSLF